MIVALLDWRTAKNDVQNGDFNDWGGLMPWSCINHSQGRECHNWWNVILLLVQFSFNIEIIIIESSWMAKSRRYFDDRIASRWNYNADLEYICIVSIYLLFNLKYLCFNIQNCCSIIRFKLCLLLQEIPHSPVGFDGIHHYCDAINCDHYIRRQR